MPSASDGYARQPASMDQVLSLSEFQSSGFDVAQVIAKLVDGLIQKDKPQSQAAFDPSSFINTFESAIQELIPLRRQVNQQGQALEKDVASKERQFRAKVDELKSGYAEAGTRFGGLNSKINEVGKTAIRIGEQLESIDRLRSRASEAHDIILYYEELSRGDTSRLEALRKDGKGGRARVAVVVRRLLAVAREVDNLEGGEQTRATVEKYAERFEKDMLRLFERAYLKGEPKAMASCARTLLHFNGGSSCVQIYVNQHDFFISRDRIEAASAIVNSPLWEQLPDPDRPAPRGEPGLSALYDDIRAQITQEAQIIEAVFPQPPVVMQVFLQRVFAQVVQGYVEQLLATAQGSSTLAFLRILAAVYSGTSQLINDLKDHEFFRSGHSSAPTFAADALQPSVTATSGVPSPTTPVTPHGASHSVISNMLDQQLDELFGQHLDHGRYAEREAKCLTELYAGYLLKFTNWHRAVNTAKPTNTIFDRVVNQLTTASQASTSSQAATSGPTAAGLKSLLKLSGLHASSGSDERGAAATDLQGSDGELRLEVAERMLKWHAESMGRMIELSNPSDLPKNVFSLLRTLADSFCKAYVETALETTIALLSAYDSKAEPDLSPVLTLRAVDLTMQLWQRYITTTVMSVASNSVTVRREVVSFCNHIMVRIEGKVNAVVQRAIDCIVSWLVICLSRQKKLDYKPKNEDLAFLQANTDTCVSACTFLGQVAETAQAALSGRNLEFFLTEVGVTFHSLLLDHLRKFPVSATGGLMLTKDLALYQDTIAVYHQPILHDRYEMLRQLGNTFIVQPSILKSYMAEGYLGRIDPALLRPYLMMRSDYSDFSKGFWADVVHAR